MAELLQTTARKLVRDHYNEIAERKDSIELDLDDVFVVWFAKVLKNWKALVGTELPDGLYYEVTYNGDKEEAYIDAYKKFYNNVVSMAGR